MAGIRHRSVSLPIALASVAVLLLIALLVGWTLLLVLEPGASRLTWLLVLGIVSFAALIAVVVLLGVLFVGQIRAARRQVGFLDSVTHELKSPLASLRLGLETLARPQLGAEQRAEVERMMRADVERLTTFIDDVIEASRASHPGGAQLVEEVDLAELVDRCAHSVGRRYEEPVASVDVEVPPGLRLHSDRAALEIVLKNLLDNALKYSPASSRVLVSAAADDGRVRLEVRDQGIGIEARHLKRVFERFYRVDEEAVRTRRGTGLGLFVVSALVQRLGGRVEARSEGPGRGTCVAVTLPGKGGDGEAAT